MRALLFVLIGFIFGSGLSVSQMINPDKIQNFLDVFGAWDASLLFVMFGAVVTTFVGYRIVHRAPKPRLSREFIVPRKTDIDAPVVIGAALFGIGWGLSGFCPGPAFTGLAIGVMEPVYLVIGMTAGSILAAIVRR